MAKNRRGVKSPIAFFPQVRQPDPKVHISLSESVLFDLFNKSVVFLFRIDLYQLSSFFHTVKTFVEPRHRFLRKTEKTEYSELSQNLASDLYVPVVRYDFLSSAETPPARRMKNAKAILLHLIIHVFL